MKHFTTPLSNTDILGLEIGDRITISGFIFAGRDIVLPRIVEWGNQGKLDELNIGLKGSVIFHSAVSIAGVGPTSSNKLEIEDSMIPLSRLGVKMHIGKGRIKKETILGLQENHSVYAVMPPITALLGTRTISREIIAFPNEGMEAFYKLEIVEYPAIIAAAKGRSIY